jgi:hypothetical protein
MIRFLRALAWLRWRLLLNGFKGSRRRDSLEQLARIGAVVAPALLLIPFAVAGVLLAGAAFHGGRKIGSGAADAGEALLVARGVLLLLLALPVLVPLGRASHGTKSGSARFLLLPIPRGALHLVETLSTLADPWVAFVVPGLLALPLGFLVAGRPVVALLALAAAIAFLAAITSLASLTAFLAEWLMRDRRRGEVFTLVFVLALSCAGMLPAFFAQSFDGESREERHAPREGKELTRPFSVDDFDAGLPAWTRALPSELYARSVRMEVEGSSERSLLLVGALLAEAGVLYQLSFLVHRRLLTSTAGGRGRRRSGEVRVRGARWPFLSPNVSAIAAVHARNALRSVRGRLAVFLPGPMVAVLALLARRMPGEVPLGELIASQSHVLLGFGSLFSLYALQAFHLNQFASDRAGLSLNFLAPISERELVKGKAIGGAVIYAAAVGLCVVCTAFAASTGPTLGWVSVLLGAAATYAWITPMAAALSATLPRTADLSKTGPGGNPHGIAVLVGTLGTMIASGPPALVLAIVHDRMQRPGLAAAILAGWLVVAIAAAQLLERPVSRIVAERRENLGLVAQGR